MCFGSKNTHFNTSGGRRRRGTGPQAPLHHGTHAAALGLQVALPTSLSIPRHQIILGIGPAIGDSEATPEANWARKCSSWPLLWVWSEISEVPKRTKSSFDFKKKWRARKNTHQPTQIWSLTRSPKTREAPALLLRAFEASVPAFLTRARAAAALAARCCACCFTCLEYFLCRWLSKTIWHYDVGIFLTTIWKKKHQGNCEILWMWDAPPIIKGYLMLHNNSKAGMSPAIRLCQRGDIS